MNKIQLQYDSNKGLIHKSWIKYGLGLFREPGIHILDQESGLQRTEQQERGIKNHTLVVSYLNSHPKIALWYIRSKKGYGYIDILNRLTP